eukprot:EG_transcript_27743
MSVPAGVVAVLVERVHELQALVARHEELHPELKRLRPADGPLPGGATERQDFEAKGVDLVTGLQDQGTGTLGHAVEDAITSVTDMHQLRRDNIRLEAENAKHVVDKAVLMRENALLSQQVHDLEAKVFELTEGQSKLRHQLAKANTQRIAATVKPGPSSAPKKPPLPFPSHPGPGGLGAP